MKLTIDIPERIYLNAKEDFLCGGDILVKAIKNGTPHETITEFADRCKECGREKVLDKIRAEIEQVKSIMNEEIINHDRKDLINFVNGLNQSLVIIDKYTAESEE